jgi:thermostable 8-oxoguanine DNA glycosylase
MNTSPSLELEAADFNDDQLKGFGPKQARNLLQWLGLTRYEIPLDSRIMKWLRSGGFPVPLTSRALGDKRFYAFVSDGIIQLCEECEVSPCILDAAVFASYDERN